MHPTELEEDILENIINVQTTSRLSCCVKLVNEMNGSQISIPNSFDARWAVKSEVEQKSRNLGPLSA